MENKSLFEFPSDYTVVDIETTGLEPYNDFIIEIACVKYRNCHEVSRFETLVKCPFRLPAFIVQLTGITDEMMATAPRFKEIANSVSDFLNGEIIVGHNVNFDIRFLSVAMDKHIGLLLQNDYVDTLRLSRRILPDLPHHTLADMTDHFNIQAAHHRALSDCVATNALLEKLKEYVNNNNLDMQQLAKKRTIDLRSIQCDGFQIDQTNIFFGKNCVFTGKLERFSREDAAQIVVNVGGFCENNVTKNTNFLIVGGLGANTAAEGKSNKIVKAEKMKEKGKDIQIISEETFYSIIEGFLE